MDRRGWLWKKKSCDKNLNAEKPAAALEPIDSNLSSVACLGDQDISKIKNFVQIPMESYTQMSELESQVKCLEEKVRALEERLSEAYSELNNKDNLAKQHAKVAEEAVSGWEKSDAEVISLKRQLESITLLKLTADDRASHLDGALKECMRQIRNVKEESERKLQDVILKKTKMWEKMKFDLEAKIDELDQGLVQAGNVNAAILESLQENSNRLVKIKEEKSQAEAEIELLKNNIQSYEKEISSLKYELHVVSKELDIRNEEKIISMRSAEVSSRQHMEDVKKISKLESECQRLRGLIRKKLPGPAALAQMKLEVENSGRINRELYLRKSSIENDSVKDSEFLTKQVTALEEETKALKEALATSNAELQASRNLYVKMIGKLKILETQRHVFNKERSSEKSNFAIHSGSSSSRIANSPPSVVSTTEDGSEDPERSVESCAASITDLSDIERGKKTDESGKNKNKAISELMDDFLEMERMAYLSGNANKMPDSEDKQSDVSVSEVSKGDTGFGITTHHDLTAAVSSIHHYVLTLGRETVRLQGNGYHGHDLDVNLEEFSASLNQFMANKTSLEKFVLKLSCALPKTIGLHLNYLSCEGSRAYNSSFNGIDVVVQSDLTNQSCSGKDVCISQHSSNSGVPKEGKVNSGLEFNVVSSKCSSGELAQVESEKDDGGVGHTEYKKLLAELKVLLASSRKSHSMAEIKLKCMTESYKSLETHVEELKAENKFLKEKIEELKNELVEQKQRHHDALARYKEIEENMQRNDKCLGCASNFVQDSDINTRRDTELAAAEQKLADCQETLNLLSQQLQALCPQIDIAKFHHFKKLQVNEKLVKPGHGWSYSYCSSNSNEFDQAGVDCVSSDTQAAAEDFSDSEECISLNSSMSSSQPTYKHTKCNSTPVSLVSNANH